MYYKNIALLEIHKYNTLFSKVLYNYHFLMDFLNEFYKKMEFLLGSDKDNDRMEHLRLIHCGLFNFMVSGGLFADKIKTTIEEDKKPLIYFFREIRNEMVHGTDVNISFTLDLKNCAINSEYVFLDTRRLKNSNRFKSNNENIQMARGYLDSLNDNVPLKDVVDVWYKYIEEKSHDIVNNICTENNLTEGNRYELWKQNNASL
jgi:hypothetical protein